MKKVSEITIYFEDEAEGTIFLGDDLTLQEVASSLRELADFMQSLEVNRMEGLELEYVCYDEGKTYAGWKNTLSWK